MRHPGARGTAIDTKRYKQWTSRFGSYRSGVNNLAIDNWLQQFEEADRDLAARILDAVDFYDQGRIHAAYQKTLKTLELQGWHKSASKRRGHWRFAAMSSSAGESGDAMLHNFRVANGLDSKIFNELFVSRSDLFRLPMLPDGDPNKLGPNDVVILLDDFSGTGTQVCDAWNDPVTSFGALLAGVGKVYLVVIAASNLARQKISSETEISLLPSNELDESDNVFSGYCKHFTKADKDKLLQYGKIASTRNPKGFGDCGFVVVFQHRPPNNSIPILHADHQRWTGLFPRHD